MADMTTIIGITGGIAAGKSTVVRLFAELGAAVVSADELARELVEPGAPMLRRLVQRFGSGILDAAGRLHRPALAQRIFADTEERAALNAIMHPAIAELARTRLRAARDSGAPLVVYEAPLLFEAGAEGQVEHVLVVTVSTAEQVRRLQQRDGVTAAEARQRIAAQWPQAEKVERADFVLDNSGSPACTRAQVVDLFSRLTGATPDAAGTSGTA
jgi:dephospho-CoA kinase